MEDIQILINRAKLNSIIIEQQEKGLPKISATIDLYAGQNKIADYNVSTKPWSEKDKLDVPASIYPLIGAIEKCIEEAASKHCMASLKLLPEFISSEE